MTEANSLLLALAAASVLSAGVLDAQRIAIPAPTPMTPPPSPPHLLPVVPVDHPAYAAQPLAQRDPETARPAPAPAPNGAPGAEPAPDPAEVLAQQFLQKRIAGRDLKKAVARVTKDLDWKKTVLDAKAASAARGLPILLVQALGDIDGFA
jgi:hypothetical protein